ncbi:DUF3800 domain-containing protein [Corynebacterium sanguinis]|uniref:DUF3800 domain-containing protein n=1 Tax=Corynebacterium sanguinis TaxID=2594913 RepID=UPI00223B974E|nr:DUF3800 domain-containing protein [Corynebacterium sanguinis]MCT2287838.1 DUF3800 domain-containing protein [Corynebacterium sanguinis]
MLLAYIDEIGSTGAFIHPTHKKFADSPSFGYGGFIIPEQNARKFGAFFAERKKEFFVNDIPEGRDPGRWERKGADLLYAMVCEERPQNLRLLGTLISRLKQLDGALFYYSEEKPIGTPKATNCGPEERKGRELISMRESLNRIARHADGLDQSVMVMMDQVNEKSRRQRLPEMYAHILGRATDHREMRRIIEPPMHIDSELSSNIQFADWVCALTKRAIDYQLVEDSRYSWVPKAHQLNPAKGAFTHNSKLHLFQRATPDLHHSEIMYVDRPVIDTLNMHSENQRKLELVRKATLRG